MATHKFAVGETIRFRAAGPARYASSGHYVIVGLRPSDGGDPVYRIKRDLDRHEVIARESDMRSLGTAEE